MENATKKSLKATTALQRHGSFNQRLLEALLEGGEAAVSGVVKKTPGAEADARWEEIKKGRAALSFAELAEILQEMDKNGHKISASKIAHEKRKSPLNEQAFYDALAKNIQTAEKLKAELDALYEEEKKKRGYLQKAFAIFSDRDPVAKAMSSVAEFEKFTYSHGIKYDTTQQKLVAGEKPRSGWDKVWDNRFLIAAAGGAALGLAGINLGLLPLLGATPGLFFGALPWLAAPFIGLNIFRSFSQYSIIKESPTLLRFAAITAAGLGIAALTTIGMTHLLPVVDPASFAAGVIPGMGGGGFSPMQYMLPIIGAFSAMALMYKRAKNTVAGAFNENSDKPAGKLKTAYNNAVGLVMNKHTAPAIVALGKAGEKATDVINKVFPKFIDVAGIPAIATLLSITMATGGLGLLGAFAGYYATAFTGLAVGGAAMMGAYYHFGARGKDFKEISRAAIAGFSISSSSATMPLEKEVLKNIGVSKKTRDTVIPLGGVFNMYGTSLYMGLTAFYALSMFGATPTTMQYLNTAVTTMAIALGAPGIPASNITLLDPVLRQTGLQTNDINKVYTMVLPADRLLDMVQTGLNVLGDMIAAVHPDRKRLRYVRAKNIRKIREQRLAAAKNLPANDNTAAPQPIENMAAPQPFENAAAPQPIENTAAQPVIDAVNDNKKDMLTPAVPEAKVVNAAPAPQKPAAPAAP